MGVNDEYSRDAYTFEQAWEDSDDSDEFDHDLDPEDWEALYSEEIYDGWSIFNEYVNDNYLMMKSSCNYTKFVELLLNPELYYTYNPTEHAVRAWISINKISIVKERIQPENFYKWFDINVNV
jgi:hypothetical protein